MAGVYDFDALGVEYEPMQIRPEDAVGKLLATHRHAQPQLAPSMAPPDVVDYVIAHELAHVEHPNHGPRFWRLVAQHMPDHEAQNAWLKENSPRLIYSCEDG